MERYGQTGRRFGQAAASAGTSDRQARLARFTTIYRSYPTSLGVVRDWAYRSPVATNRSLGICNGGVEQRQLGAIGEVMYGGDNRDMPPVHQEKISKAIRFRDR